MRLLYARRAHMSNIRHVGRNILKGTSAVWSDWVDMDASTTTSVWLALESKLELLAEERSYYHFHLEVEFKDVELLSDDARWLVQYLYTRISDGGTLYGGLIPARYDFVSGVYEYSTLLNKYTRANAKSLRARLALTGVKLKVRFRCAKLEVGREYTGYRP